MCCIGKSTGFVVVAIIEARNWYLFYVDFYLSFAQCHGVIVIRVMMSFTCPHTCLKGYGPPSASAVDIILLHLQTKIHHSPAPPYPLSLSLSLSSRSLAANTENTISASLSFPAVAFVVDEWHCIVVPHSCCCCGCIEESEWKSLDAYQSCVVHIYGPKLRAYVTAFQSFTQGDIAVLNIYGARATVDVHDSSSSVHPPIQAGECC